MSRERRVSGRRSRNNRARIEWAAGKMLQAKGIAAVKASRAYQPAHDIVPLRGRGLYAEVKARADRFRELYGWLHGRHIMVVKADHQEPLVVLRMSLAAEIAGAAERSARAQVVAAVHEGK